VSGSGSSPSHQDEPALRPTVDELKARLAASFPDAAIEVSDDSHLHAGHAGAAGGAGHYTVRLVCAAFSGRSSVARHRLVYHAVADWIPHRVHALAIVAKTPSEVPSQSEDPSR
jgi:BolA family transcriptional regulator, general stress-responsive regulator